MIEGRVYRTVLARYYESMAAGEVLGGAGEEGTEFKVPIYREPSANLPRGEETAELTPPKPIQERWTELTSNVRELGLKALDHLHGALGGEQDRHIRAIRGGLEDLQMHQEDDRAWLHVLETEIENGLGAEDSLRHEIGVYTERCDGRQAIIAELEDQLEHAQWQDEVEPV